VSVIGKMFRRALLSVEASRPSCTSSPIPSSSLQLLLLQRNVCATHQPPLPVLTQRRHNHRRQPRSSRSTGGGATIAMSTSSAAGSAGEEAQKNVRDTIIIGSGPAGYTAGKRLLVVDVCRLP